MMALAQAQNLYLISIRLINIMALIQAHFYLVMWPSLDIICIRRFKTLEGKTKQSKNKKEKGEGFGFEGQNWPSKILLQKFISC